jgi:hypothetical protein
MLYDKEIKNEQDVWCFINWCINDQKLNLHPDNDFSDYIFYATNNAVYTENEAMELNDCMTNCFALCGDIYNIVEEVLNEGSKIKVA